MGCTKSEKDFREAGSVMLLALVVMLLLTILGISATKESVFEIKMVGNQTHVDEAFVNAESAINLCVRSFRSLPGIDAVLNDTKYPTDASVKYSGTESLGGETLAKVEIRRIFLESNPAKRDVATLSPAANAVPQLSHRYYDGSMDKKRFAITATAIQHGAQTRTWVQKGISLPAEQNRNLF